MSVPAPAALRRRLVRLRRRGEALELVELAQELLALRRPAPAGIARRVVAAALGGRPEALPERIEARHLRPAEDAELADRSLEGASFAVVDLETTGLATERAQILEIGAVRVVRMRCAERFESLVRPRGKVPPRISALTGIVDAQLAGAPTPRQALGRFRRWLGAGAPAPLVAHNASFDARFLERGFREQRLRPYRGPLLCTRRLARRLLPSLGRYNLDQLCAQLGIANRDRHRGPGDAQATARALIELLRIARWERGVVTLGELFDLQESPPPPRRGRRRGPPTAPAETS